MCYKIIIEPTGDEITVNEGQTILDAALRQGVYLPHACSHGLCGTCKVEVLEGQVDLGDASPFALLDIDRDENKCLVCVAIPKEDCVIEADVDEDPDSKSIVVRDFEGTVIEVKDLTPRIKGIVLELNEEIEFQAGQYVQFYYPGFDEGKSFSIATSSNNKKVIELNISIVPDGEVTPLIHQNTKVGDKFRIVGPYGRFFIRESAQKPMIFFAGGSGLSSPKAMIEEQLENGCKHPMALFHGARSVDELYYADLFRAYEKKYDNFKYYPVISDENATDWDGEKGYVGDAALKVFENNFMGHKAYLCGPPPMIESCISCLFKGRLFERDIYLEKFFSKADQNSTPKSPFFKSI